MLSDLRSPIIDQESAALLHTLLGNPFISSEGIYLALTATKWRYAYMEVFRLLESVLHVPWMLDLKSALESEVDVPTLYGSLRDKLAWKESKGDSIRRVFRSLNGQTDLEEMEASIGAFKGIPFDSAEFCRSSVGSRIYKIRNQLVHPEDFTDGSKLDVSEDDFQKLTSYLAAVVGMVFSALPQGSLRLGRRPEGTVLT
jgi:hypothetical protein